MKIQHQIKLHNPAASIVGNCMMTCYASYFDLDISEVPNIEDLFHCNPPGFWYRVLEMWLAEYMYKKEVRHENDPFESGFDDYYFAIGMSPRGILHQVIYKGGLLFHDPHPSGAGLRTIECYVTLENI